MTTPNVKVPKEKDTPKEYYRDNLEGIEETVSIKTDDSELQIELTPEVAQENQSFHQTSHQK